MTFSEIVNFHGHSCPGLAMGYRMALAVMAALGIDRSSDEEVVAVVENDACGVDALQCLTGCTFGKGNLVFRDYGKSVYTLWSRTTGRGARIVFHGREVPAGLREDRAAYQDFILTCPESAIISRGEPAGEIPQPARIRDSLVCQKCGEKVMATRVREQNGLMLCIPCTDGDN